ncbi:MAG: DUF2723 domain-containing protein [Kiritimatiellia bacterium]|nr:DUF2723 domain-containing protein [Kiritimatiellia bacterium]
MKPIKSENSMGPAGAAPGPIAPAGKEPFFRRLDWSAFWTVSLLSLLLYFYTLAPTVTLEDGGELAVASDYLGVPHPPGYPIWTLVTWFFQWIFHWVRYYGQPDSNFMLVWKSLQDVFTPGVSGHPNPSWSVGLASAVFGAFACGILALLVCRSSQDMLRGVRRFNETLGASTENLFCWAGAVSAGLLLACSPVLWSQSVIVEVYSLNGFFQILVLLLLYRWMSRPKDRAILYALAFLFGLGLTNHQTLLFMGLALAVAVLIVDQRLFRDFFLAGAALGGILVFNMAATRLGRPDLLWIRGPESVTFWIQTGLAVAIPVAAIWLLPNGRTVAATLLLLELGVAFYFYLPFSGEQNPPMNWGYPRTWDGFMHAVTRGQYERISPADIFSERFLVQLGLYLTDLRGQFTLPITLVGFLPFCAWRIRLRDRSVSIFMAALVMAMAAVPLVVLESPLRTAGWPGGAGLARTIYMLLIAGIAFSGGFGVLVLVVGFLTRQAGRLREATADWGARMVIVFTGLLLALAVLYADWMILRACFRHGGAGAFLFGLAAVLGPPALGILAWRISDRIERVTFEMSEGSRNWILTSGAAFFSVSFIFLAVLNNAPDVQTQFIGRVQFIQSHAIYALWLGYGAVLAMAYFDTLCRAWPPLRILLTLVALALPGVLLWQNAYDEEQIRVFGGAEQDGHDFGWQFGHWSLRGVRAILEELPEAERADFPDPEYPPEMDPDAVFFGGTDPGRFVPTYMIYSANVRPDVFLITQNALADATYMNVMRDLYGNKIWIPSANDNNLAFDIYLQDVRAGRIHPGADIQLKDERVSVQGVQGVMHINGILARMIFERNKFRHSFYVEESYVIPWMYPYLEPHGLILKLNPEPIRMTPEIIQRDRAFWDWLTARLLANPKFQRDIVAQKTFSKLRAAIAGIYSARQLFDESEYAFRQSIALYPLSPEATFRLADSYLQQGLFEKAFDMLHALRVQDPYNDKVRDFEKSVGELVAANRRREEIETQFLPGMAVDVRMVLELVALNRKLQRWTAFDQVSFQLLSETELPTAVFVEVAQLAIEVQRWPVVELALRRALSRPDASINLWVDLMAVLMVQQKAQELFETLDAGLAAAGEPLRRRLRADTRFAQLRNHPEFLARVPPEEPQRLFLPQNLQNLVR